MLSEATTVFQQIEKRAESDPRSVALSDEHQSWTYAELCSASERLASGLLGLAGDTPGSFAVISDNRPEVLFCWLAGSRCGLAPSIVNPLLTPAELATVLSQLQPRFVVVAAPVLSRVGEAMEVAHLATPVIVLDTGAAAARGVTRFEDLLAGDRYSGPHPHGSEIFEIAWTSGTTAVPKGVALSHAGVSSHWSAVQRALGLDSTDVGYVATPLYHQAGLRHTTLVTWLAGGRVHLAGKFSPRTYWDDLAKAQATFTCLIETILHILSVAAPAGAAARSTLRLAVGTSKPATRAYVAEEIGLGPYFCYGSTETGVPLVAPVDLPQEEADWFEHYRIGAGFAGWPTPGCQVKIAGEGEREEEGIEGEILVKSPGMLRQYWRDGDATDAAFVDGWFKSGDLGLRGPRGSIYFLSRLKDLVRRGGENIACGEIEDVLIRHPDVLRAAVVSVPDPIWIEEVKAVVVVRDQAQIDPEALWRWCCKSLAEFKVPRYIEYRRQLPESASGKVQKAVLRQEELSSGPSFDRSHYLPVGGST